MPENDSKSGRKRRVEDSDILEVFKDTPDPVLSTSEVAEQLPIKRRGTLNRLQSLEDRDVLGGKTIGGRNTVWWLPDAGARNPTGSMRGDSRPPQQEGTKSTSQGADSNLSPESGLYSDLSFPGSKDRQDCIAAINAVVSYLGEHGPASMREIVVDVMPEFPLGYDVPELKEGERYRGSWWRGVIKPGLEADDDVKKPPKGGSKWSSE